MLTYLELHKQALSYAESVSIAFDSDSLLRENRVWRSKSTAVLAIARYYTNHDELLRNIPSHESTGFLYAMEGWADKASVRIQHRIYDAIAAELPYLADTCEEFKVQATNRFS